MLTSHIDSIRYLDPVDLDSQIVGDGCAPPVPLAARAAMWSVRSQVMPLMMIVLYDRVLLYSPGRAKPSSWPASLHHSSWLRKLKLVVKAEDLGHTVERQH
jgi:hypothetical protein